MDADLYVMNDSLPRADHTPLTEETPRHLLIGHDGDGRDRHRQPRRPLPPQRGSIGISTSKHEPASQ